MDFFGKQEEARRRTRWLIAYFVLAVVGIIAAIHVAFCAILGHPFEDMGLLGATVGGVLVSVTIGALVKTIQLTKGGKAVAELLGGTPVNPSTAQPAECRLRNIVEEMSLASGVPVPSLYILDEPGINAFAAGYGPTDAAIGVTRGCLENLNRDELQGVIAHEFSHILNGDMRLNIRLMGLLHGILFLAIVGGVLMRVAASSTGSRSGRNKDGNAIVFLFLAGGLVLYIVGWIGVFFAKLIKAAVSRQREFLADASAVQYTRNPDGLAGALSKIQSFTSRIAHPRAEEASHMFFGNGLAESWFQLFATHPPIDERIREIAPSFQTSKKSLEAFQASPAGHSTDPHLAVASSLIADLPPPSLEAAHELHGACALVYSLLLPPDQKSINLLDSTLRDAIKDLQQRCGPLSSAKKIALVDLAVPALRGMSPAQYETFRATVKHLVESDGQVHLFEYTLQKLLLRHLDSAFKSARPPRVRFRSIVPLLPETGILLSALANADAGDTEAREASFQAGVAALGKTADGFPLARLDTMNLADFDKALDKFATASFSIKKSLLDAASATVMRDASVNDPQFELLRAMADTIDCPIPPHVEIA